MVMIITSFKINKKLLSVFIFIVFAIILALIFIMPERAPAENADSAGDVIKYTSVSTNEDRINFLRQFGWEVEKEPVEVEEVIIPKEFDDVYIKYNEIQLENGLDLSKYKSKRVKRWTYIVKNYPNTDETVRANLLIYNSKVIGGDISSVRLDGFMHGFRKPQ